MKIVIGSKSKHKKSAVELACKELNIDSEIMSEEVLSGQDAQPVGFQRTYLGALTRAHSVFQSGKNMTAIGIENGLFVVPASHTSNIYFDIAVVVVMNGKFEHYYSTSAGFLLPQEYVNAASHLGFKTTTVGDIIQRKIGGDSTDPISTLTHGKVSRVRVLCDAVKIALLQIP